MAFGNRNINAAVDPPERDRGADVSNPNSANYDPSSPDYDKTQDPSSEYYIDRQGTAETGSEMQDRVGTEAMREAEIQYGDIPIVGPVLAKLTGELNKQVQYRDEISRQTAQLTQGLDTRNAPGVPGTNYTAEPHQNLKHMVNDQASPEDLTAAGELWTAFGNGMVDRQDGAAQAINKSEADWRGSGGDSARAFLANLGNWAGKVGQGGQLAGTQAAAHSDALAQARSSMPEPVEFDVQAANRRLQNTSDPFAMMKQYAEDMAKYQAQQEAHQRAAKVVTEYDNRLAGSAQLPAFKPPDKIGASDSVDGGGNQHTDIGGGGGQETFRGGSGGTGTSGYNGGGVPGGSGAGIPSIPGGSGGAGGAGGQGGGTPLAPGAVSGSGGYPGGTAGQNYTGSTGFGRGGFGGRGAGSGGAGGTGMPIAPIGGMAGAGGAGGDTERGGGRFGGGRLGTGGGGAGAGGSGSGSGGPGGPGARSGSAMGSGGSGAAAAGGGAAGGRGSGAGARGMMGAPMGAGRGQGGEDEEHQTPSYLDAGDDPENLFGTDEMTAPPVIGE